MGAQSVGQELGVGAFLSDANPAKPFGRRAFAIAIIIEQGVLGAEPVFVFVKLSGLAGGGEPSLKQGSLAVLIQIRCGAGNGQGEVAAQSAEIAFGTAAGGGEDDAIGAAQGIEKRGTGGGAVDHGDGALALGQPSLQFGGGQVRAVQVELGRLAIKRAVTNEHEPEGCLAGLGFDGQSRFQIGGLLGASLNFMIRGVALCGGGFPVGGPLGKLCLILGRAGRAGNDNDSGAISGREPRDDQPQGEGKSGDAWGNHGRPFRRRRNHSVTKQSRASRKMGP